MNVWRVRSFTRLTSRQMFALTRATVTAVVVELGLRLLSFSKLIQVLGLKMGVRSEGSPDLALCLSEEERVKAWAASAIYRDHGSDGRCLKRALLTGALLRHRHPAIWIGANKLDGRFHAHSWIEIDGHPLDRSSSGLKPLQHPRAAH